MVDCLRDQPDPTGSSPGLKPRLETRRLAGGISWSRRQSTMDSLITLIFVGFRYFLPLIFVGFRYFLPLIFVGFRYFLPLIFVGFRYFLHIFYPSFS